MLQPSNQAANELYFLFFTVVPQLELKDICEMFAHGTGWPLYGQSHFLSGFCDRENLGYKAHRVQFGVGDLALCYPLRKGM